MHAPVVGMKTLSSLCDHLGLNFGRVFLRQGTCRIVPYGEIKK